MVCINFFFLLPLIQHKLFQFLCFWTKMNSEVYGCKQMHVDLHLPAYRLNLNHCPDSPKIFAGGSFRNTCLKVSSVRNRLCILESKQLSCIYSHFSLLEGLEPLSVFLAVYICTEKLHSLSWLWLRGQKNLRKSKMLSCHWPSNTCELFQWEDISYRLSKGHSHQPGLLKCINRSAFV